MMKTFYACFQDVLLLRKGQQHTCEVHTLLNVTKINVCTKHANSMSRRYLNDTITVSII